MRTKPVPLIRSFTTLPAAYEPSEDGLIDDVWGAMYGAETHRWPKLLEQRRVVILADAGAGKTFELKAEAERQQAKGRAAFFIRIEDIDAAFGSAFEAGTPEQFEAWLGGAHDAWFFLDSVDETRLEEPRAFESAIRTFSARIHDARHRAFVYVSSRPYAWRGKLDREMIEERLPYEAPRAHAEAETDGKAGWSDPTDEDWGLVYDDADSKEDGATSAVSLYRLAPLQDDDIRIFAGHRGVADVDGLLREIERRNLHSFARRPFDLEDIIAEWEEGKALSSRLSVLKGGVVRRLTPPPGVLPGAVLPMNRALAAARQLALVVLLTGRANIWIPGDGEAGPSAIDPRAVLTGWTDGDIVKLLSLGIFDDPIYRAVRFRHREVRELLAAECLSDLIAAGNQDAVEALIFKSQYGEAVIVPRLRPILPWLILLDDKIRERALALEPQIGTEGGDVARLPLVVRQAILSGVVGRILNVDSHGTGGDNAAVARIAEPDLEPVTLDLIDRHGHDDSVIFFLGRVAWQGGMSLCAPALQAIALDPDRGDYARIVSARAVAAAGDGHQKALWRALLEQDSLVPRQLVGELIDGATPTLETVQLILDTMPRLEPAERYTVTGLSQALGQFIDRLPVHSDDAPTQPLATLVDGLDRLLGAEPHIERGDCRVSKSNQWLMGSAVQAVGHLVSARAKASLAPSSINVMINVRTLRQWTDREVSKHQAVLETLVPRWPELNDALFWRSIEDRRRTMDADGKRLADDWPATWIGHFWAFDAASFDRTIGWIRARTTADDRSVALHRCHRTYRENGRPRPWLKRLEGAVVGDPNLESVLEQLKHPVRDESARAWRATERRYKRRRTRAKQVRADRRAQWIDRVKADPEAIRQPVGVEPGQVTGWQYELLNSVDRGARKARGRGADWQRLIPEFGQAVAEAYRDAARDTWRAYRPGLRSEGADRNSFPAALLFAMAGLEIEAGEDGRGLNTLPEAEAGHALRYGFWELNGFPRWFEPLYRAHPQAGFALVWSELVWELENDDPGRTLHDIVYHAPWLHGDLAPALLVWLSGHQVRNLEVLRYCRTILTNTGTAPGDLAALAEARVLDRATPADQSALWHALWIDVDAGPGLQALEHKLSTLPPDTADTLALEVLNSLPIGRADDEGRVRSFRTPQHLARLYTLAHRHVRAEDDIERANKGVYSPTARDYAQDARNGLIAMLVDIQGPETHEVLKVLAANHPDPGYRPYLRRRAHDHAVADSDLKPMSVLEAASLARTAGYAYASRD